MPSKQIPASTLTSDNATAVEELGARRMGPDGKVYRFIQAGSGLAQGYVVGWQGSTSLGSYIATPDISKCPAKRAAGVALGTVTINQWGWIQSKGLNTHAKTDGGVAAGNCLVWKADMIFDTMAAGEEHIANGFARIADSGSIGIGVNLDCLD